MSFCVLGFATSSAFAEEALDPKYSNLIHPIADEAELDLFSLLPRERYLPRVSDAEKLIGAQSPVKSQGSRGTCSFFSSVAILESKMIIQ